MFPETKTQANAQGYRFEREGWCRGCEKRIWWYRTPKGKMMPVDPPANWPEPAKDWPFVAHFTTCEKANDFKKAPAGAAAAQQN